MYTAVIADDHGIVREGIKQLLAQAEICTVVGEATNGLEAISTVKQNQPDLLLLDVSMPYANALEVIVEAKRWSPRTKIVVFTGVSSGTSLAELMNEGIEGLLLKQTDSEELLIAIKKVLRGERHLQQQACELVESVSIDKQLTSRERQVLQLICRGNTNAMIADLLSISVKTVDNHRTNLMKKLSVHSISELMARAMAMGLIDNLN